MLLVKWPKIPLGIKETPFTALKQTKRKILSALDYINGIKKRDRTILGRAITLIESNITEHQELAQQVLTEIIYGMAFGTCIPNTSMSSGINGEILAVMIK